MHHNCWAGIFAESGRGSYFKGAWAAEDPAGLPQKSCRMARGVAHRRTGCMHYFRCQSWMQRGSKSGAM